MSKPLPVLVALIYTVSINLYTVYMNIYTVYINRTHTAIVSQTSFSIDDHKFILNSLTFVFAFSATAQNHTFYMFTRMSKLHMKAINVFFFSNI